MIIYVAGVFLILHGLVHLLYFGQSQRIFELSPGMVWPDGAWVFGSFLGETPIRWIASVVLVVAALGLIAGGLAIVLSQHWWQSITVLALALSSLLYLSMWNGRFEQLSNQGAIGLLINVAILVAVLVFRWPQFGF